MHPAYSCGLIGFECNQTIGNPRVWWDASYLLLWPHWVWTQPNLWDASCLLLWPHWVWMQPNLGNSKALVRCMPVYSCGLIGCECSQTTGIPRVWWDASCLLLWPHWVWMQPNHRNSQGLVRCILFTLLASLGVNATEPYEFLGFGEMHPFYSCVLIGCECNQIKSNPRVWSVTSCLLLWPHWVWMQANHRNS